MSKRLSFGCELEWSDIDRSVDIPVELGEWEGPKIAGYYMGSEIDIVNTKGRWRGVGTDPLCVNCPVGGEIHVQPSYTIDSQMVRIMRIMNLFFTVGVACPNHGHIHIGVKGIKDDLNLIKNIFTYTKLNELDMMKACCGYNKQDHQTIMSSDLEDWVKSYLLIGDGKQINPAIYDKIENAESVDEVIDYLNKYNAIDYDWVTGEGILTENSHRTCLNLYNLVKGETVEFRIFRSSIQPVEIYSALYFAQRYMEEAMKGIEGKPVVEILKEGNFKFAPLNFDYELAKSWQETRSTKNRSGCFKHYMGTTIPAEEPAEVPGEGFYDILKLCKLDFNNEKIQFS